MRKVEKNRNKYPKDKVKGNTDLITKLKHKKWSENERENPTKNV